MRKAPINRGFLYPERDLNPHNRYGHRILSPACLPFHHPGILFSWMLMLAIAILLRTCLFRGMVECPPLQSGCSLKTPTRCFLNVRPYHPGGIKWCKFIINNYQLKKEATYFLLELSGRRDSNPRPRPWQGRALPTELLPQLLAQK
jgi:hypothetical protein